VSVIAAELHGLGYRDASKGAEISNIGIAAKRENEWIVHSEIWERIRSVSTILQLRRDMKRLILQLILMLVVGCGIGCGQSKSTTTNSATQTGSPIVTLGQTRGLEHSATITLTDKEVHVVVPPWGESTQLKVLVGYAKPTGSGYGPLASRKHIEEKLSLTSGVDRTFLAPDGPGKLVCELVVPGGQVFYSSNSKEIMEWK